MDVPLGKYFELTVTFDPSSFIFQATWNGDDVDPYPVSSQELVFSKSSAQGDMSLNYLGFSFIGKLDYIFMSCQDCDSPFMFRRKSSTQSGIGVGVHLSRGSPLRA